MIFYFAKAKDASGAECILCGDGDLRDFAFFTHLYLGLQSIPDFEICHSP
jgi:hypothetical protein